MAKYVGKYELVSSENYGEFLKAIGVVDAIQRNLQEKAKPTVEIATREEILTIKTLTALKNTEYTFKLGEETDIEWSDGRRLMTVINQEADNKLVQVMRLDNSQWMRVMEFFDTEMRELWSCAGVTSTRMYKRI